MPLGELVKQAYELVPSNGNLLIHVGNEKAACVEHWQALQLASTASRHKKTHGFRERSGCVPQSGSRHNEFRSRSKITFSRFPFMFVFVFVFASVHIIQQCRSSRRLARGFILDYLKNTWKK